MKLKNMGACALMACAFVMAAAVATDVEASSDDPRGEAITLGYIEDVSLGTRALEMKAKLDTGADTSSVYARDVKIYKKGEKDHWVRFRLIGKNGRSIRYDQNVIRFVHIKTKKGGSIRRPVIHLPLCVGGVSGLAEINLADRTEFNYDVLIGREFLAHRILVDSGQTFLADEPCARADAAEKRAAEKQNDD